MRALVACECSGKIRDALIAVGVDAISCDLKQTRTPGPHYCGDVRDILHKPWDLLIAHPVCKYLTNAGVRWLHERPERWALMREGAEFFKMFLDADHIPKRAIENPIMHKYAVEIVGRKADQYIQPWWFGDPYQKATGWWLEGLPDLVATHTKDDYDVEIKQECWLMPPGPEREELRSNTYPGHAREVAKQWGKV